MKRKQLTSYWEYRQVCIYSKYV